MLGAAILTLNRRTLPAQVLSSLGDSPLAYRFAGGFALVLPALIFIALMRRYLHQHVGRRSLTIPMTGVTTDGRRWPSLRTW